MLKNNNNTRKYEGIKDILEEKRYRVADLQRLLTKDNIPGNWSSYMNVSNLCNGSMPRDAYVFLFLADLLEVDLPVILSRYSDRKYTGNRHMSMHPQGDLEKISYDDNDENIF